MRASCLLMAGVAIVAITARAEAQDAGAVTSGGLDDIVVTATRRAESLQSVPIAVTALSGDRLEDSSIVSLKDIAQISPGLQILPAFVPGNPVFQIRGQFQSDTAPTIDSSVGLYFDDVYIARSAGSLANFLDVQRVEVLKGPQGTLFGKNTTGGAVRIMSNRPTNEFEGYGKIGYQSFDRYLIEGVVNVPIGDGIAFRAAAQHFDKRDGAFTNRLNGKPIDTDKTFFGRGSLLLTPNDRLEVLVQGDYTKVNAGGVGQYLKDFVVGNSAASALNNAARIGQPGNVAAGTAAILAEIALQQANPRMLGSDVRIVTADRVIYTPATATTPASFSYVGGTMNPFNNYKAYGGAVNASYDFGFATLRSITALRRVRYGSAYNLDGLGTNIINKSRGIVRSNQFSQELLLNGQAFDGRLDWTIGGIYFNESTFQSDKSSSLPYLSAAGGTFATTTIADSDAKSYGFFAQGTFDITDALSVTAGARRSTDKRGFVASAFTTRFDNSTICSYTVANGLATLPIFSQPCNLTQSDTFKQWSYTGSINYEFGPSQLVYVRTGRGYRSGGFNSRVTLPQVLGSFRPEVVTDYEIGLKADWLDRRLRTNIAAFKSKSKDTQQTSNGVVGTTSFTRTANIGTRKVKGVEVEITAAPTDFLSFDSNVAYTTGRIANPSAPDQRYLPNTPRWTFGMGGSLHGPVSETLAASLRVDMSFRDKMYDANVLRGAAPAGSPVGTLGPIIYIPHFRDRTLLNARLSVTHAPTNIEFSVFGTNLTNQLYEARQIGIAGLGSANATYGEPRVIGVELKVPFGAMADR